MDVACIIGWVVLIIYIIIILATIRTMRKTGKGIDEAIKTIEELKSRYKNN